MPTSTEEVDAKPNMTTVVNVLALGNGHRRRAFRIGEHTSRWQHPSGVELSIGSEIWEPTPDEVLTGLDDRGSYRVHACDLS
jgi:hypothetical protein